MYSLYVLYVTTYLEASRAHAAVAKAVKDGILAKKPCEICGKENSEAHHPDYGKPLEVKWLCSSHHRKEHVRLGKPLLDRWTVLNIRDVPEEIVRMIKVVAARQNIPMREVVIAAVEAYCVAGFKKAAEDMGFGAQDIKNRGVGAAGVERDLGSPDPVFGGDVVSGLPLADSGFSESMPSSAEPLGAEAIQAPQKPRKRGAAMAQTAESVEKIARGRAGFAEVKSPALADSGFRDDDILQDSKSGHNPATCGVYGCLMCKAAKEEF